MKNGMRRTVWLAMVYGILGTLMIAAPATGRADQNDERLEALFGRLKNTEDPLEAQIIEGDIWQIWTDSGRDDINTFVEEGIRDMAEGRLEKAIANFNRVVTTLPEFAEGWNKRATAHYLNENYTASMIDIKRTLALEPRHFGAISGIGLIFMAHGDEASALQAFEEVLQIHPHARGVKMNVERLRKKLRAKGA